MIDIKKIKINKKIYKILIITILCLIIYFSGFCLAKYKTTKQVSSVSKIALPILNVEGAEITKISGINNKGYYNFVVKNYENDKVSEVPLDYYIEIISNTDESVNFKLYKDNELISLNNKRTEKINIKSIEKTEHSYRLEVTYDKNKSTSEKDILEDVQLKIHSEQARA